MRMCEHLTRRPKVLVFPFSAARTFKLSTSLTVESDLPVLALAPPVFIFECEAKAAPLRPYGRELALLSDHES